MNVWNGGRHGHHLSFCFFYICAPPPQQRRRGELARRGGGAGHRTGAAPARTEPTATATAATTRSPAFPLVTLVSRLLMWPETDSEKAANHYDLIFQFSSENHLQFVCSFSTADFEIRNTPFPKKVSSDITGSYFTVWQGQIWIKLKTSWQILLQLQSTYLWGRETA